MRRGRPDNPSGGIHAADAIEMVRVLSRDPGLGCHLSPRDLAAATPEAIAPLVHSAKGTIAFAAEEPLTHDHLGLLLLDGLIARHVTFGQIGSTELLGPGDVLRPTIAHRSHAEVVTVRLQVIVPADLAELDRDFATRVRHWPGIVSALLERAADRTDSQLLQAALRQTRYVEDRVLLALWHFAGRWGTVGPQGRALPLNLITGEVLASIVGARRQSVSSALGALADRGLIIRNPDGFLTVPDQPHLLRDLHAQEHGAANSGGDLDRGPVAAPA